MMPEKRKKHYTSEVAELLHSNVSYVYTPYKDDYPSMKDLIVQIVKEHNGIKARDIAKLVGTSKTEVNSLLYHELIDSGCYTDGTGCWHFNPSDRARDIILNSDKSLLVLGKAGTGKSTFIRQISQEIKKNCVILAPTGIAAIEINGTTIHSFFRFDTLPFIPGTDPRIDRLEEEHIIAIKQIDTIVIDEISMVRADLLDRIDASLRIIRRNDMSFGGVQMLLIGDIRQLPPVVESGEDAKLLFDNYDSEYFFDSKVFRKLDYSFIEFSKVYRQENGEFVSLLNRLRDNCITQKDLDTINDKYQFKAWENISDDKILICTHNIQAKSRNRSMMEKLPGTEMEYTALYKNWYSDAPAPWKLRLKVGAKVMFTKNKPAQHYYNGVIGSVVGMGVDYVLVQIFKTGEIVSVKQETWYSNDYSYDKSTGNLELKERGSFTQIPLRLAWAITVHKSQGQTFDKVILNLRKCFADGQAYVAMSRCRSLEGITMMSRLKAEHIKTSDAVDDFLHELQTRKPIRQEEPNRLLNTEAGRL